MNDTQLEIFIAVSDAGSFSKAEQSQYLTKQAMLKQVHSLEDELSVKLFERHKKGVTLTPEGEIFYEGAKQLLAQKRELLVKLLKETHNDTLRIGNMQHQVLLDPITQIFQQQYPDIQIDRVVHPNHSGEYRVENNIQDIAESFLFDDNISSLPFHFEPLIDLPYMAIVDLKHPLANLEEVTLEQLSHYQTTIFPMMCKEEYVERIQQAYENTNHLICSDDVDHQIETIFSCISTHHIVIGANPFIYQLTNMKCIPITPLMHRTYGLIYKETNLIIRTYLDIAKKYYSTNPFTKS